MQLKTLADFKRALAVPGVQVQLIENTICPRPKEHPIWNVRSVHKIQSNAVAFNIAGFNVPAWLEFGKASAWSFEGARAVNDLGDRGRIVYDLLPPA